MIPDNVQFVAPVSLVPLTKSDDRFVSTDGITSYAVRNGIPFFISKELEADIHEERTGIVNALKTFLRSFPKFYVFLIYVISPVCFVGLSPTRFLKRFSSTQLVVSVGAGIHRYGPHMLNTDIFPYKGIDVVADAMAMPFATSSVDGVVCEYLLEHVPHPEKVVAEIARILRPGGQAYITIPFVYPFHASPNDFYRWSATGLRTLCSLPNTVVEKVGPRSGPTSALVAQLVTWSAIVLSFGYEPLYNILSSLLLLVFFPLKFLDVIVGRFATALHGPGSFYIVMSKTADTYTTSTAQ